MSAVDDDGDADRGLHLRDGAPVGFAAVELLPRAAVDRDGADAERLGARGEIGRVLRGVVPAQPHLQRHRPRRRVHRCGDQAFGQVHVAHQRRAGEPAGHFLGRAAHVDVDEVGAGGLRHPRAPRHPFGAAADELDHGERQAVADRGAAHHVGAAGGEELARHHLGRDIGGAEARGGAAERQVRHAGHRRGQDAAADGDAADGKSVCHSRTLERFDFRKRSRHRPLYAGDPIGGKENGLPGQAGQ